MVRTGVMRAWGDRLKRFIEDPALGNRVSAFWPAAMATAILGSGTAMTLIVAGIAASGAIGTASASPCCSAPMWGPPSSRPSSPRGSTFGALGLAHPALRGLCHLQRHAANSARTMSGRIMIGLGLMLLSLKLISAATAPLREATLFHELLTAVGHEPLLAFIIGAVLAWAFPLDAGRDPADRLLPRQWQP